MGPALFKVLVIVLGSIHPVYAQEFKREFKYFSIGWSINAMNYVGELDPGPGFFSPGVKFTRENIGLSFTKRVAPRISFRGNISRGVIQGDDFENASWSEKDIHRKIRNLSFKNTIWELKADAIVDFFQNRSNPLKRLDFIPYMFLGIAYYHHNPKARAPESVGGNWVELQPLQLEGKSYSLHQLAVPVGIGFRYKLNKRWDVAFEMGWRFTFTDYLDDASNSYKGKEHFGNNQLAIAMNDRSMEGLNDNSEMENWVAENQGYNSFNDYLTINGYGRAGDQRGDPKRKDVYIVTGFHFTYIIFPKVIKCMPKHR